MTKRIGIEHNHNLKIILFLFPIHLVAKVQWWSKCSTQILHFSQCIVYFPSFSKLMQLQTGHCLYPFSKAEGSKFFLFIGTPGFITSNKV